jgi:hypothetical protein
MRRPPVKCLSIEQIEEIARDFKDDLTRECERQVRQHTPESSLNAYAAVQGKEYIDKFLTTLKMVAGSEFHKLSRPARARDISLQVINKRRGQ